MLLLMERNVVPYDGKTTRSTKKKKHEEFTQKYGCEEGKCRSRCDEDKRQ